MKTSEAFNKMVELGLLLGVKSIKDFPGAWLQKVDDVWTFAVNGHEEEMEVGLEGGMGVNLDPYNAAVWKNGWLAATLSPVEGVFLGGGEDEFIAALDSALAKPASEHIKTCFRCGSEYNAGGAGCGNPCW